MKTNVMKSISFVVYMLPIFWILGIKFFIFHLLALSIFIKTLMVSKKNNEKVKLSIEHKLLFTFIIIYTISIIVNIKTVEVSRVIASIYNLTYWIIGLFTMISIYNDDSLCKNDIFN